MPNNRILEYIRVTLCRVYVTCQSDKSRVSVSRVRVTFVHATFVLATFVLATYGGAGGRPNWEFLPNFFCILIMMPPIKIMIEGYTYKIYQV